MVPPLALAVLLFDCKQQKIDPDLALEAPERIVVTELGPVPSPPVVLGDGIEAEGVAWSAAPEEVARVEGGVVHAVGPGEAEVTVSWEGEEAKYTLVVDVVVVLRFEDPPEALAVGEQSALRVTARAGEREVPLAAVAWTSSDPNVLAVDDRGTVTGIAAGTAYVTATAERCEAMLELPVR